ncbi:MAG: long-chain-fatty-acid--CoA ligase [Deltaproteobacteria bacterium]|nr:MAG: long-chain-fatty-acid--CoA ligase [Deltaproteobacteria bacterium]
MEVEYKNIRHMLEERARLDGEKVYIAFYDRELTYEQFNEQVNRFANGLLSLGVKKGDIVYIHLTNCPEHLIASLGTIKIGAIAGPINTLLKAEEIKYELNDSKGKVLVTESLFLPIVEEMKPGLEHIQKIIELGDAVKEGNISFHELIEKNSPKLKKVKIGYDDLAFIFYTSGTTGKPKGALLNHGNVLNTMIGLRKALNPPGEEESEEQNCALIFLPLFHVNAMMSLISGIQRALKIVLLRRFSVREFGPAIEKHGCEFFSAVPKVYKILLEARDTVQQCDLSSLKFGVCGAAPMPVETIREFEKVYGVEMMEGYGLTEATVASTRPRRGGKKKIGSLGPALDGQEVKIMDPEGKLLPSGETGEIVIRGPSLMVGYYGLDEETKQTLRDGWLHTGDIGYMDEDGFFYIVDREKDMIIKGGENIYPKEIEDAISKHPAVYDAAVIGIPDKVSGEEVKAFVVPRIGKKVTPEEIIEFCQKELAEFKVPKEVDLVLGIPASAVGKSLKRKLREGEGIVRLSEESEIENPGMIFQIMPSQFKKEKAGNWSAIIQYELYGKNEGVWSLVIKEGNIELIEGKSPTPATAIVRMYNQAFRQLIERKIDGATAINSGQIQIEGSEADVAMFFEVMG